MRALRDNGTPAGLCFDVIPGFDVVGDGDDRHVSSSGFQILAVSSPRRGG
jgi:hypothetical protein